MKIPSDLLKSIREGLPLRYSLLQPYSGAQFTLLDASKAGNTASTEVCAWIRDSDTGITYKLSLVQDDTRN